jgi:hypothetical protein
MLSSVTRICSVSTPFPLPFFDFEKLQPIIIPAKAAKSIVERIFLISVLSYYHSNERQSYNIFCSRQRKAEFFLPDCLIIQEKVPKTHRLSPFLAIFAAEITQIY